MALSPDGMDNLPDPGSQTPAMPRTRHLPPAVNLTVGFGAFLLAIVLFVVLFQWNWLRGPLAQVIAGRLHRPVAITGDLEVHPWSWSPALGGAGAHDADFSADGAGETPAAVKWPIDPSPRESGAPGCAAGWRHFGTEQLELQRP